MSWKTPTYTAISAGAARMSLDGLAPIVARLRANEQELASLKDEQLVGQPEGVRWMYLGKWIRDLERLFAAREVLIRVAKGEIWSNASSFQTAWDDLGFTLAELNVIAIWMSREGYAREASSVADTADKLHGLRGTLYEDWQKWIQHLHAAQAARPARMAPPPPSFRPKYEYGMSIHLKRQINENLGRGPYP